MAEDAIGEPPKKEIIQLKFRKRTNQTLVDIFLRIDCENVLVFQTAIVNLYDFLKKKPYMFVDTREINEKKLKIGTKKSKHFKGLIKPYKQNSKFY